MDLDNNESAIAAHSNSKKEEGYQKMKGHGAAGNRHHAISIKPLVSLELQKPIRFLLKGQASPSFGKQSIVIIIVFQDVHVGISFIPGTIKLRFPYLCMMYGLQSAMYSIGLRGAKQCSGGTNAQKISSKEGHTTK